MPCYLLYDDEAGEGEIQLSDEFKAEPAMLRADVLRDWLYAIEAEYEAARRALFEKPPCS